MAIEFLTPADCTNVNLISKLNEIAAGINSLLPPEIESVTPNTGPQAGGTEVVIIGKGFTGATGVNFALNAGTSFSVVSDTEINVTTPAGAAPGVAPVIVQHPNGNSEQVIGFTYT